MTIDKISPVASTCVSDTSTRSFVLPANTPDEEYHWYPMYVKYCKELVVQEELNAHDFRTFVPMETIHVKRGSSVHAQVRPAIHNLIFVYSFRRRISWMKMYNRVCEPLQYMSRHYLDGHSEVITVTDKAMENIIRAASVEDPDGHRVYIHRSLSISDVDRRIKFISGAFQDVEGIIKRVDGNRAMVIPLTDGLTMKITITRSSDIEFL